MTILGEDVRLRGMEKRRGCGRCGYTVEDSATVCDSCQRRAAVEALLSPGLRKRVEKFRREPAEVRSKVKHPLTVEDWGAIAAAVNTVQAQYGIKYRWRV